MTAIAKNDLVLYLKDAIEIESDILTQEQLMQQQELHAQRVKPQLTVIPNPAQPVNKAEKTSGGVIAIAFFCALFFVLAVIMLFAGLASGDASSLLFFLFLGVPSGIPLFMFTKEILENRKKEAEYQAACQEFELKKQQIAKVNKENELNYQEKLAAWNESNRQLRQVHLSYMNQSVSLRNAFYAADFLYPKYRNLPALTSIYEYLITGRCEELTGPHGAYNMYEDEVRKDTVISQLNTVIANLEKIRQNQYMLYQQVTEIQRNTSRIVGELQQIKGYTIQLTQLTALNAYYSALNERNTRITAYYHL